MALPAAVNEAETEVASRYLFGALVVILGVAIWPGLEQPGEAPRRALLLIAGPLLFAVASRRASRGLPLWLAVALGLPLAVGVGHVLMPGGGASLPLARELATYASLAFVTLAAAIVDDADGVDAAIGVAAGASLIALAAIGLGQAHFGFAGIPQAQAPAATFVNRNVAAQALVVLIPLAAPLLAGGRAAIVRWPGALAVGGGTALLLATRTRGAWVAATIGWSAAAAVWLVTREPRAAPRATRSWLPPLAAAAIVAVALVVPVRTASGSLASTGRTLASIAQPLTGSGAARLAIWHNSLALLGDHPWIGVGPGAFGTVYPRYNHAVGPTHGFGLERQPQRAHMDPLEFAIEFGAPAAVIWCTVALSGVVLAIRARRFEWAAGLGALLVHALISFPLHSPASAFLFALVLGRAWSTARGRHVQLWPALAALMLVIASAGAWVAIREVAAERSVARALGASASGDCDGAAALATRGARFAPWSRRTAALSSMVVLRCSADSLPQLERALRLNPAQPNLLLAVGAKRLEAGRIDAAAVAFGEAVEILPSLGRAWVGLASARALGGDTDGAALACLAAIDAEPGDAEIREFCTDGGLVPP